MLRSQETATTLVGIGMAASLVAPIPTASADAAGLSSSEVCGQRGAFTLLVIGSDAAEMRGPPGADLTRLARIDFSQKKVNIFALPRDLWVDVNRLGFQNPLITNTTLGKTYYEAHERSPQEEESDKMVSSAQATAQMILDNFQVTTDHYFMLELSQLPTLIDAIGGLPINVAERITDPWIGMVIEAGPQILTGTQLAAYARAIPDSDFARIQRSNIILQALQQKMLEPAMWGKLPALIDQFKKMFVTDLSPQQISNLFCLLQGIPSEEIIMEQIKPEWTSPGPSDSLLWDKDKIITAFKQLELIP
jgi:LCP family protein required for cell wall assembly